MILMTREGGATSERLLTISVWALVWTFSGMDSPVTSERAGIAEWLFLESVVSSHVQIDVNLLCRIVRTCVASRQCGHAYARSTPTAG